jgi:hypothetical protein
MCVRTVHVSKISMGQYSSFSPSNYNAYSNSCTVLRVFFISTTVVIGFIVKKSSFL